MKYTIVTPKNKSSEKEDETVVEGSGKLDFGEYELELWDLRYNSLLRGRMSKMKSSGKSGTSSWLRDWVRPSCVPLTIIVGLSMFIVAMALLDDTISSQENKDLNCFDCRFQLVESIPENLTYPNGSVFHPSIYSAWVDLIESAETSIDIVAFYWTLLNDDVTDKPIPSSWEGEDILHRLNATGLSKKATIRIAQNAPSHGSPQYDSALLAASGAAEVRSLDFDRLMGAGVLHTKMWVVDGKHIYVGSANMDWRSLTQVKEVGIVISNCSCMAADLSKIFEVYWKLGEDGAVIPPVWPSNLQTAFNIDNQMPLPLSGALVNTYLSSSPPPFCPKGRSNDIDAILDVINKAEKFIYVAVMDYFPRMLYTKSKTYWPFIDDRLRTAAWERGVRVRILGSYWNHTRPDMKFYLKSLQDLNSVNGIDIETRLFVVPSYTEEQAEIPFSRVNHNKYMVTDNTAYIGTSNWSGDYFVNTGGVGLVVNETKTSVEGPEDHPELDFPSLQKQLQALFERDWSSEHAKPIEEFFE